MDLNNSNLSLVDNDEKREHKLPEGITMPESLNNGKIIYTRDFFLAFLAICQERLDTLPKMEALQGQENDIISGTHTPHSGNRSSRVMTPSSSQNFGLSRSSSGKQLNNDYNSPPQGRHRTAQVNMKRSGSGPTLPPVAPTGQHQRYDNEKSNLNRSHTNAGNRRGRDRSSQQNSSSNLSLEPVEPLQVSENRWMPTSLKKRFLNQKNKKFIRK